MTKRQRKHDNNHGEKFMVQLPELASATVAKLRTIVSALFAARADCRQFSCWQADLLARWLAADGWLISGCFAAMFGGHHSLHLSLPIEAELGNSNLFAFYGIPKNS